MKTAFIIDSSASISEELLNHPDVYTVDLVVTWGDKVYSDTMDVKLMKDFYARLTDSDTLPKTSQPEPACFVNTFEEIKAKNYDAVFCITLASAISGTYNTARMISQEYKDYFEVYMIDSKGTSFLCEKLLITALDLLTQGLSYSQILEKLDWFVEHARIYVIVDRFDNLVKGGRMSSLSAFLGSQLRINPILYFDDTGKLGVFEKVRTKKKVYRRWIGLIDEAVDKYPEGIDIAFAHGDCLEEALKVKALVQEKYPEMSFRIGYLTPVLGTHGGKNTLGMGILPKVSV